ncbi:huntingtin-interacting protein K-like [Xenia sp. Carnegie-2017]|uniref:huntingtin-interacting protein K-like n=1 Tax=Xenia sp. Carnegie-2017 TaxID=2897299 RepID=UPI001F03D924|nr:huntingtin-interacting protein K-like [Xenia sp. Carnegie-2017]
MTAAAEEVANNNPLSKTFDSKASADLERVTDYEEDKEISPVNIRSVIELIFVIFREKELAKVSIKKEDVVLIMKEMEISKSEAEWSLRSNGGDVVRALISLTN